MKKGGGKAFTGPLGKRIRGTHAGGGSASVRVGSIRTPYKDKILGR